MCIFQLELNMYIYNMYVYKLRIYKSTKSLYKTSTPI